MSEAFHTPHPTPHTRRASRPAFSLIELLVVIAIIVILVGLAVAGINVAYQRGEESTTKVLLAALAGVEKEYRAQTGQSIPSSANGDVAKTGGFLELVQDNSGVAGEMLRRLDPKLLSYNAAKTRITEVNDPWGKEVYFNDGSGTAGVASKSLPKQTYPYFVSAGPDGDLGTVNATTNVPDAKSEDNLYSYEVK